MCSVCAACILSQHLRRQTYSRKQAPYITCATAPVINAVVTNEMTPVRYGPSAATPRELLHSVCSSSCLAAFFSAAQHAQLAAQWCSLTIISSSLPFGVLCSCPDASRGIESYRAAKFAPFSGELQAGSRGDAATTGGGSSMLHPECTAAAAQAHLYATDAAQHMVSTRPECAVESATGGALGSHVHSPPTELAGND